MSATAVSITGTIWTLATARAITALRSALAGSGRQVDTRMPKPTTSVVQATAGLALGFKLNALGPPRLTTVVRNEI